VITLTPEQQAEFRNLVHNLAASNFACGEWTEDGESYEDLYEEALDAENALFRFVGMPEREEV
jgi:hypothetical protein